MKRSEFILVLVVFLFTTSSFVYIYYNYPLTGVPTTTQPVAEREVLGVLFSPKGGCKDFIIYWIDKANSSIKVMMYSFTLQDIADALVLAKERGVDVRVLFEEQQITQYSQYQYLDTQGVSVKIDSNPYLMHHKVLIIDNRFVLVGSFNWSTSGETKNNENLILIKSQLLVTKFNEEFNRLWEAAL